MGPEAIWFEVGAKDAESCIVVYPRSKMENWEERKPSIGFECEDIQRAYEEMSARGVAFPQKPKVMRWGPFAVFRGTDGNEFGLREG